MEITAQWKWETSAHMNQKRMNILVLCCTFLSEASISFLLALPSSNLFSLWFSRTSCRDRMFPKVSEHFTRDFDRVSAISVCLFLLSAVPSGCDGTSLKTEENIKQETYLVSLQTIMIYKDHILSGWKHLKDSPLWWRNKKTLSLKRRPDVRKPPERFQVFFSEFILSVIEKPS